MHATVQEVVDQLAAMIREGKSSEDITWAARCSARHMRKVWDEIPTTSTKVYSYTMEDDWMLAYASGEEDELRPGYMMANLAHDAVHAG